MFSPRHALTLCMLSAALWGCSKKADDTREWRASDHDRDEQQDGSQVAPGSVPPGAPAGAQPDAQNRPPGGPQGMPSLREYGITDVTLATWKQNCTQCHGLIGRGDGPQGAMTKPTDLTSPEWQKSASDDRIRQSIKQGRNRMPSFAQLPDDTIDGLLKFVRLLNSERPMEPEAPPAGSGAPAGSASAAAPPGSPSAAPVGSAPGSAAPASTQPRAPRPIATPLPAP